MNKYHFFLIRTSLYDEEGYVIRFFKGVLPSNTLIVLNGLLKHYLEILQNQFNFEYKITLLDEIVDKVNINKIKKNIKKNKEIGIVFLAGIQSNQFSRATDLALEFKRKDFLVFVGGFHVSGILSVFKKLDSSLEKLIQNKISIVAGEVEDTLPIILNDIMNSTIKEIYNFLENKPNLEQSFLPEVPKKYLKKFAVPNFSTIDLGRGCPYRCSFCTIINVHGNEMRYRNVKAIQELLLKNYYKNGINYYFFTDDNFARNKNWKQILEMIIDIKKKNNISLRFMIQADTLSYKIPDFIYLLKEAGCTQVFIGMESLNPENLKLARKRQNKVEEYHQMINCWNQAGINVHTGYIIGFPNDTKESLKNDIILLDKIGIQQASFFILTPLPGSLDHKKMLEQNLIKNFDLNFYDSFHLVWKHPNFTSKEMEKIFFEIWKEFYSFKKILKRIYKLSKISLSMADNILGNYLWYKYSIYVNHLHPMISGFHRKKSFFEKRSNLKSNILSFTKFLIKRIYELNLEILKTLKIGIEFLILWSFLLNLKLIKLIFKREIIN